MLSTSRTMSSLAALALLLLPTALAKTAKDCVPQDVSPPPPESSLRPLLIFDFAANQPQGRYAKFARYRAKYMLALVIGAWCEAIGLVLRIPLRTNVQSNGLYIVMYLFVVLSVSANFQTPIHLPPRAGSTLVALADICPQPCAFLAADYILLGRIVDHLDASRHLRPLQPKRVSWVFIVSDIITFLVQAAGGGVSDNTNPKIANIGSKIFLAGIAAQMASFALFTIMWLIFIIRVKSRDAVLWNRPGWKKLNFALGFTCICFLTRSVYRTVELSQGYIGYLATHEGFFLGLDTLPLFLGITVYVYFWPGKYLMPETKIVDGTNVIPLDNDQSTGDIVHSRDMSRGSTATARTMVQDPREK
ncbi:hypothetical protein P7C73_g3894, partial [Tremellales sp. Uapishka_1]